MKKIYICVIALFTTVSYSQKEITYEQFQEVAKRVKAKKLTKYVSKNGEVFEVGKTLTIGSPSGAVDTYDFVHNYSALGSEYEVSRQSKGFESEIIKFNKSGSKRKGYEITTVSKTETGTSRYYIQLERAIESGEIETSVLTRDQAISKLKEQKDLLDLGLITEEEYKKSKEKLTPLIMDK